MLDAPEFSEISDDVLELLAGRVTVAHNASFDMRFLHQELLRSGYDIEGRPRALCSMKWAGRLLGPAKLQHCCEALGIPLDDAHAAVADAEATGQLLARLIELDGHSPEWEADISDAEAYVWPRSAGRTRGRTVSRPAHDAAPASWMAKVLDDAWIPGANEDEAAYLLALGNALLDFQISATEGRNLTDVAAYSGLSRARILELHRAHLDQLAAEAWSDGVLSDEELADLCSAAAHLGLDASDVAAALSSNREHRQSEKKTFLQRGDRVVFTGEFSRPRDLLISEIVESGLVTGGVTKSTRAVVAADPDSLSGKAVTARRYEIPVIDERAFEKYFAEYRAANHPMAIEQGD